MAAHSKISGRLREVLLAVLAGNPTREQLNHLIAVCQTLASSFISGKSTLGGLRTVSGLTTSDLAVDCIADLFRQNEHGAYAQLQAYFSGLQLPVADNEEILTHLRRLVFSKVNQGIFRCYSESDPALAKILRNLKLAVGTLKNFTELERFGEQCLTPALCDRLEHCPPFDRDELERFFLRATTGKEMIPDMMAKLSLLLRDQNEHCRIIPLVTVGLLIRSAYEKKELPSVKTTTVSSILGESEMVTLIQHACAEVSRETREKFVNRKKIDFGQFEAYFKVVEEALLDRFQGKNGDEVSLYDRLRKEIPGLTKIRYINSHRNRVEYFLKLTGKKLGTILKE
jgi:hypothetical protein